MKPKSIYVGQVVKPTGEYTLPNLGTCEVMSVNEMVIVRPEGQHNDIQVNKMIFMGQFEVVSTEKHQELVSHWQTDRLGSFTTNLLNAIQYADRDNCEKLRSVFPFECEAMDLSKKWGAFFPMKHVLRFDKEDIKKLVSLYPNPDLHNVNVEVIRRKMHGYFSLSNIKDIFLNKQNLKLIMKMFGGFFLTYIVIGLSTEDPFFSMLKEAFFLSLMNILFFSFTLLFIARKHPTTMGYVQPNRDNNHIVLFIDSFREDITIITTLFHEMRHLEQHRVLGYTKFNEIDDNDMITFKDDDPNKMVLEVDANNYSVAVVRQHHHYFEELLKTKINMDALQDYQCHKDTNWDFKLF